MENLIQEIAELERQEMSLRQQIEGQNPEVVTPFINQFNIVSNRLSEKRLELQLQEKTQDAIIAEAYDPDSSFSLSAGGFVADFRALAKDNDEYQMLSVTTQLYLDQLDREHKAEIKALTDSFQSSLATANEKSEALEGELDQTREDLSDVRGKLEIANNKITDLEIERDGAVKEVEAQNKQIEELRLQITEKPKVATNLDGAGSLAEINARLEAKKIPVYNVRAGDHKTSFYLAQLAETGEEIEIRPYYDLKSKYREVSDEEAARFQSELEANKADVPEIAEPVESGMAVEEPTIEAPTFRDAEVSNDDTADRLVGNPTQAESISNNDGGESFEQEVRRRLGDIEQKVFGHYRGEAA